MTRTATSLPYIELPVAEGNFDRTRSTIDRIIIHTMVGTWQSAASRFATYAAGNGPASAHYGVKYDGGLVHWLEETFTAYHAGDYTMNQRSIGIEHEDMGNYNDPRPDVLYAESAKLVVDICAFYKIPIDRTHILKHNEVSDVPTGCPDALDIDRIVKEAQKLAMGASPTIADDELWKKVEIDQIINFLFSKNFLTSSDSRVYKDKNAVLAAVENLFNHDLSQTSRAGKWDLLLVWLGITNDSNSVTVEDVEEIIKEKDKKAGDLYDENIALQKNIKDVEDQLSACHSQMEKYHSSDSSAIDTGINAQQDLQACEANISIICQDLGIKNDGHVSTITDAIDKLKKPSDDFYRNVQTTIEGLADAAFYKRASKKTKNLLGKLRGMFP